MIGKTISHYSIVEKLGEGGMGIVYKARDVNLDRSVAIKFLSPHLSQDEVSKARFIQEARTAAAISHPSIMGMFEIGEHEGGIFLAMEYIEGETLRATIRNLTAGDGVPLHKALDWTVRIGNGLKAAHDKGVMHRDIKPENIMLTTDGQPKIMDFGLAKLKGSTGMTRAGASLGTLSYMSPELLQGLAADHRCDIWALGVVLYEMLTGELPFKAEHEAALLYMIVNEGPPAPSALDRRIPHQVDSVVMRMLEKDRDRRYQSTEDVLHDIELAKRDIESSAVSAKKKAIAVLPFDNISPDGESDYFSDGLTEEIIANLSRLKDMRVVSRTTSMQYKGTKKDIKTIGRELGARYIMEGSVRKFQDNLRITAQLIEVESDEQLWAETYKGKLEDVFDIQEQVSNQIVEALMLKLSPFERVVLTKRTTLNAEAFDCYLRARDFLYKYTKLGVEASIELFQKAITSDARYADAYAGLSEAYATLYQQFERKDILLERALESGLRALMYDPSLSEAYSALGVVYLHKKAHSEALESSLKAIDLNPNNASAHWILGRIYHTTDNDREAITYFRKAIGIDPDIYSAYMDLWASYERMGDDANYRDTLRAAVEMYPRYLTLHPDDARAHIHFAIALARSGRLEEAKVKAAKALELSPKDPLMFYNAACFYSTAGDTPLAIQSLRNAISTGYEFYEWIKRDTDLDPIRHEPEYVDLMKDK